MPLYGPLSADERFWMWRIVDFPYHPDDDDIKYRVMDEHGPIPDTSEELDSLMADIRSEKQSNEFRIHLLESRNRELDFMMEFLRDQMRDAVDEEIMNISELAPDDESAAGVNE